MNKLTLHEPEVIMQNKFMESFVGILIGGSLEAP